MGRNGSAQITDWQRLNAVFETAVEMPTSEQKVFLDENCADDPRLRAEVERLLTAARKITESEFLSGDAFQIGARVIAEKFDTTQETGKTIGKFRLVSEIAHGGMGAVYLADREDFEQRVAVKLIRHGFDSAEILRRFRIERDVLASLNHPNIARLLDGGTTDDGQPFLAIEYVEGERIDRYCDAQGLDLKERLELFRKVCAAVAYAHQNLTVHRDIKPSNILVTETGEPKLLDFGIAKILAGATPVDETATADRLLTPEYASPEQLRGAKITTASDIYSLGVLLYELLTGGRPFELKGRSAVEIIESVCNSEPAAPSSREPETVSTHNIDRSELRGDLDNIILTALRKDPGLRYSSVEQLSEDVLRYLDGRPVIARAPTLKYRAVKFVRRNRVAVGFAAVAASALIIGTGVATWQAVLARREKASAEKRFNEVRSLANTFVSDWDKGLNEESISPEVRGRLADISSDYLARLAAESDDPELLREAADAQIKLGHAYAYFMIDNEKARQSLLAAQKITRHLLESNWDDTAARGLLIQSLLKYDEFFGMEDLEAFTQRKLEQIELREKNIAENPQDVGEMRHLALAHEQIAWPLRRLGREDEINAHFLRADELHRRRIEILEAQTPTAKDLARLSYSLMDRASNLAFNMGDSRAAIEPMQRATAVADESVRRPDADRSSRMAAVDANHELGTILIKAAHDYEGAIVQLRKALAINRGFEGDNKDGYFRRREADSLIEIATSQHTLGRDAEAAASIRQVFELSRAWLKREDGKNQSRTYLSHAYLMELGARLLAVSGRSEEASAAFDEAEHYLNLIPLDPKHRSSTGQVLAWVLIGHGDLFADLLQCRPDLPDSALEQGCVQASLTKSSERRKKAAEYYRRSVDLINNLPAEIRRTYSDLQAADVASARLKLIQ